MTSKPCPFCTLPSERIVEENQLASWIYDGFPVSKGHSLIIPKRHLGSFFEISLEERLAMLELLDKAKTVIDKDQNLTASTLASTMDRPPAKPSLISICT